MKPSAVLPESPEKYFSGREIEHEEARTCSGDTEGNVGSEWIADATRKNGVGDGNNSSHAYTDAVRAIQKIQRINDCN